MHQTNSPFRGGYWSYGKRFIEQLPIRPINFADPAEKERLERQIHVTDGAIDRLVYELYGLTEEEIKIVES